MMVKKLLDDKIKMGMNVKTTGYKMTNPDCLTNLERQHTDS